MTKVVAVSGGVDSVVLLEMLVKKRNETLIVAHFDHGIREDSASDARFVEALACKHGLEYEQGRGGLGSEASEGDARTARYEFLKTVARKYNAKLATAHHANDVIESIAINIIRGTGWRGLAVMNDQDIERPLLGKYKQEIYQYAAKHNLEFVEDETNKSDIYLRNRVRHELMGLPHNIKQTLLALREKQVAITQAIDRESSEIVNKVWQSRYFFTMIDDKVALELLRAVLARSDMSLTRPQRMRLLHALKTAHRGTVFEAGSGVSIEFTPTEFIVKQ